MWTTEYSKHILGTQGESHAVTRVLWPWKW